MTLSRAMSVRSQAEKGGRSTSEYGRGSEVGGRGSGLGSERGLGEAISNASSYTPVSSVCKRRIGARLSLTVVGRSSGFGEDLYWGKG